VSQEKRRKPVSMPAVVRKLGPGVIVREKKDFADSGAPQPEPDYQPSQLVFRRKK
jgi:hypothetical protein